MHRIRLHFKDPVLNTFSDDRALKIQETLVNLVYNQAWIGLLASLLCASIVFISQYDESKNNNLVYTWVASFLLITVLRAILVLSKSRIVNADLETWRFLFAVGAAFGGATWGMTGLILFPNSDNMQQMLIILMLGGVTAGAVPLTAAIPEAAIGFLLFALIPLATTLVSFQEKTLLLFDLALTIYIIYLIILAVKTYRLTRNSLILKFENDALLTYLEKMNKKLAQASTHDPLTRLPNRRFFEENFQSALDNATLTKSKIALLYLDLDHFKEANDRYGHYAGDQILLAVAERLISILGTEKNIARLGGDEFSIIVREVKNKEHLKSFAEQICQIISIPIVFGDTSLKISVSIGISIFPDNGVNQDLLMKNADKKMYMVKKRGGDNFQLEDKTSFLV